MIRAGAGYSVAANPRTAAVEATQSALRNAGLRTADAVICFASSKHGGAFPLLVRTVGEVAGTAEVAGCGSIGVIAGGREIESGHGVAALVMGAEEITVSRFFVPQLRQRSREVALELAVAVRPRLGPNNLLCLFADTYNLEPEPFIATLAAELPGVTLVGGGASEDGAIGETFQFCGDVVSSNSVSATLLAGDLHVSVGAALACAPIGPIRRVTAARDNVILELDGRRAYDVFAEAAGPLMSDIRRASAFMFLGVPVAPAAERLERGAFFVRNITGVSAEHGALAVAHRPAVGDRVGFVLRDAERSRNELKAMLEMLSAPGQPRPAFGLYFNCVSRGSGLYNLPDHDSAYIGQHFGDLPIAGLFTGFEIGPLAGAAGLLQYSGVLALISEPPA
ncbi:MAG TPA: FIST N-terminal domain-containing protein [Candidatus Binataceae bacterium]|nr:FIST N-terminal domain-containing protein [Candidatus Binataceae bacterium]